MMPRFSVCVLGWLLAIGVVLVPAVPARAADPSAENQTPEAAPPAEASPPKPDDAATPASPAAGESGGEKKPIRRELKKPKAPPKIVNLVYLGKAYPEPIPLSLMEPILTDKGIQGARLGIHDNNVTGSMLGIETALEEHIVPADGDIVAEAKKVLAGGDQLIVADLDPTDLLAVADLPEAKGSVILNIRSSDDRLREENCRFNVVHIVPNWAMRADALAQYLIWKKWPRWFVIRGSKPEDADYVAAIKRSATRFGGKVVEERTYQFEAGARRVETGHQQIQTQMPLLTQGAAEHDVIFVADTGEAFGDYLPYRTYDSDPVVGTQGLVATVWHRAFEQWGGMSLQSGFQKQAHRDMTERDYTGWLAVRAFGEASTRSGKADVPGLRDYIFSDKFKVAGFKGQQMTIRDWDHQLRQPILLMGARSLVSMSPQEGFLHEKYPADTLGFDAPETKCRFPQTTTSR